MLAWFFGLGTMTRVATYLGAIFGAGYAVFQFYDAVVKHF